MKQMILALIAAVSLTASAKTVTVHVCEPDDRGGTWCHDVTYVDRGPSPAQPAGPAMCPGDREPIPCPTEYGVPGWLQDLNQWFVDRGFEAPDASKEDNKF